jgi:hypothetical protein
VVGWIDPQAFAAPVTDVQVNILIIRYSSCVFVGLNQS